MSSKSKIILALDTNNFSKTEKLIKNISNEIFAVKIGYQFYEIDPVKKIIDIKKFSSSIKDGSSKNILLKANWIY